MLTTSKVFLVIGTICSVIGFITFSILFLLGVLSSTISLVCVLASLYGILVTIGALVALNSRSFRTTFVLAIICFPIAPLASIFMFLIDESYFYPSYNYKKVTKQKLQQPAFENVSSEQLNDLPFEGILIKEYSAADDFGENVSIDAYSSVKVVGFHKASNTCTIEIKNGDLLRTIRQVPSSIIGIIKKEKVVQVSRNDEIENFPCEGLMLNKYFGADEKGKNISIEKDFKITIVSSNKSLGTYKIEFIVNKTKHSVDNVPTFYVKKINI